MARLIMEARMGRVEVEDMTVRDILTYCQMLNRYNYRANLAAELAKG